MSELHNKFWDHLATITPCRVLEIGTRGWDGKAPVHHKNRVLQVNPAAEWTGVDIMAGEGVDVVADIHQLSQLLPAEHYHAAIAIAVWEHLARPWTAAKELAKVIQPGGMALISTHQTFPYHAYPKDYFRFSREALGEIFAPDHGWRVVESAYEFPCTVVPKCNYFAHAHNWNFEADAWLTVSCLAERV